MKPKAAAPAELPILLFEDQQGWSDWLDQNASGSPGVWLRFGKKKSGIKSIYYAEALDVALCHGWIDSQTKSYDESSYLQKFTPRGPKSIWSKINREKVQALTEAGRMRPAGLLAVESAKKDGRWDAAYDSPRNATVPEDLQTALDQNPKAKAFFETLGGANRFAILFRIQTVKKPETRVKKIAAFMEMLERGEKIHS